MRVSLKWLKEFVDITETTTELVDKLDLSGTKVEAIHQLGGKLDGVVVGRIEKIEPHPNADSLTFVRVNIGDRTAGIVCGAPNIAEGQTVPVALVGAELPNGMVIRKAKIRGIESEGMMCSEVELGLGEDHSGIMILEDGLEIGAPLVDALGLSDTVLELEVTPNRPDCLSMIGIAREVGAVTGRSYTKPQVVLEEVDGPISKLVEVEIADPELCPRYCARLIENVKVGPSPRWMQERLIAAGIRPISNVVDVTNYIMMETGQPLHAFDYDKVADHKIIVRRARPGEDLVTLDDVDRQLSEDMLLITDPSGPIALAGVMGGAGTEVSEQTRRVLLEGANFNPASISRTSRRLGLLSEASMRFERGADINGLYNALDRAAQLMAEMSEGDAVAGIVDEHPQPKEPWTIWLRPERASAVIGVELSGEQVGDILRRLELEVLPGPKGSLDVTIPTFRPDLEREIDLVEEIARLHGFNAVSSTLPASGEKHGRLTAAQRMERLLRSSLEASGVYEAMTYSFIDPAQIERLRVPVADADLVLLENPLSAEQSVLRPSLLPGLVASLRSNVNRGIENAALYEIGRVFVASGKKLPHETLRVGVTAIGSLSEAGWYAKPAPVDFFDSKGIVEALMTALGVESWSLAAASHPTYHPGRCAAITCGEVEAGLIGELHPEIQRALDLPSPVALIELDLEPITSAIVAIRPFRELARHPAVMLDLAVVVDEPVGVGEVEAMIAQTGGALLEGLLLFDVYRGEQVEAGRKSLAFQMVFRAPNRTLTDDEVDEVRERIVARLAHEVRAVVRAQ